MQQAAVRKEQTCSRSLHVEMQWIHLCTGFLFSKGVDFSLPEQIVHWGKVCWGKHWCCAVENAANIGQTNPSLSSNGRSTWSQAGSASSHKIRCRFQNIILFTEHECKLEIVRIIMTNTHLYDELGLWPVLSGSHKVTLVTPMEKTEIEQMSCHLTAFSYCLWKYTEFCYITQVISRPVTGWRALTPTTRVG